MRDAALYRLMTQHGGCSLEADRSFDDAAISLRCWTHGELVLRIERPGVLATRSTDPETSRLAAHTVRLGGSQIDVLAVMREFGPMSDDSLVRFMESACKGRGIRRQSPSGIRTRRRELVDRGLVVDTGNRVTLQNGRKAILWQALKPRIDQQQILEAMGLR